MEKEIRMPFTEYEALLNRIKDYEKEIERYSRLLEEKDNVLICERDYANFLGATIKVLKFPVEGYSYDEMFKENLSDKNNTILNLRGEVSKLKRENEVLKSKIPWWRK